MLQFKWKWWKTTNRMIFSLYKIWNKKIPQHLHWALCAFMFTSYRALREGLCVLGSVSHFFWSAEITLMYPQMSPAFCELPGWLMKTWEKSWRISSAQSFSRIRLFATPWAAHQASLSITNSQSLLKPMSTKSVTPSKHLIFCRPLLLLPSIFPSSRVFSNESVLRMRWPKYWSFRFSISWRMEAGFLGGWDTGILFCPASPHRVIKSPLKVSLVYPHLDLLALKAASGMTVAMNLLYLWRDLCFWELISFRFLCVPGPLMVSKQTMIL